MLENIWWGVPLVMLVLAYIVYKKKVTHKTKYLDVKDITLEVIVALMFVCSLIGGAIGIIVGHFL